MEDGKPGVWVPEYLEAKPEGVVNEAAVGHTESEEPEVRMSTS